MDTVPIAIMIMVVASTFWRPIRSPRGPKKIPPRGRMRKLMAKVAKVATRARESDRVSKKTADMVTAR